MLERSTPSSIPAGPRWVAVAVGALVGFLCFVSVASAAIEAKPFGITKFTLQTVGATTLTPLVDGGEEVVNEPYAYTQAGGHPWALTTNVEFTTEEVESEEKGARFLSLVPTRDPKDIVVGLPPGLLGDPLAVPRCPLASVLAKVRCPGSTQLGVYRLQWSGGKEQLAPIVNVTPEAGQSAEFALEETGGPPALLTAHIVHTEGGYGFTVVSDGVPGIALDRVETTFWGVPADPSHDPMRGLICGSKLRGRSMTCQGGGEPGGGEVPVPFVSMPTDCAAGPQTATLRADPWEEPGSVSEGRYTGYAEETIGFPGVTGCNVLGFGPSIEVSPDTALADAPVGLGVDVKIPQNEQSGGDATPHLRNAVVTLPEGLSISPGVVDGIQACNETGPEGINFPGSGPESEERGLNGELQLAPGHCPDASTVGTAEAVTPDLSEPVKGHVYLARPLCGGPGQRPCTDRDALDGRLYQLYLEFGGVGPLAGTGINVKVRGFVEANPATGQLTTVVDENPQVPISEVKIHLNGGPRASVDNPAVCGPAVTTADLTPWSAPGITPEGLSMPGTPDVTPASHYNVEGCSAPVPFAPGLVAGMVTPQAGQFSAFTLNLARQDREQFVKGIQVHTPPGLLGMLSSVQLCEEPLADNGHCPESSKIGTTRVASGAGSHPFEIGGTVYLTGPYDGAPFGLSIVTPAVAGPFNLGLVVVRATIAVNPENSTLTVTTDETGPHAVPQILDGVPLRLKSITVNIDRPDFMFNPTNCGAPGAPGTQQVTATISGSEDAKAIASSALAVGGCKSLEFKPKFTVSTSGKTSRANGASLDAKLSYPAGSMGEEANIAAVKVDLPKQLPSRLTTLQKACTAATFETNPSACPAASTIGIVKAVTPLLPVPLTGPVYFVSHGGEAFPSLVIVLQGDGVRVNLTAATFISNAGITSSTFKTIPDVPVSTFEIYLPEGRYSALAANGNLCASKLSMPTAFVAQNGAEIHQNTKIAVTGCPKTKKVRKTSKKRTKAKHAAHNRRSKS